MARSSRSPHPTPPHPPCVKDPTRAPFVLACMFNGLSGVAQVQTCRGGDAIRLWTVSPSSAIFMYSCLGDRAFEMAGSTYPSLITSPATPDFVPRLRKWTPAALIAFVHYILTRRECGYFNAGTNSVFPLVRHARCGTFLPQKLPLCSCPRVGKAGGGGGTRKLQRCSPHQPTRSTTAGHASKSVITAMAKAWWPTLLTRLRGKYTVGTVPLEATSPAMPLHRKRAYKALPQVAWVLNALVLHACCPFAGSCDQCGKKNADSPFSLGIKLKCPCQDASASYDWLHAKDVRVLGSALCCSMHAARLCIQSSQIDAVVP